MMWLFLCFLVTALSFWQTKLYTDDWIGLKSLDDAGRVRFISVSGNHLGISESDMKKHIVPYLVNKTGEKQVQDSFSSLLTFR